jgi:hypothetical protein
MAPWIGLYRWVDIFWKSNGPSHGNSMLMSVKREKNKKSSFSSLLDLLSSAYQLRCSCDT